MTDFFSIPQIVGYLGILTTVVGYKFKNEKKMKTMFSLSALVWAVHYFLINANTAAAISVIVSVRTFLSLNATDMSQRKKINMATFFSAIFIIAGIVTWSGPVTIIPVLSTIIISYAVFFQSGLNLRSTFFLMDLAWLVHGFWVNSYSGIIYGFGALAVNGYMMLILHNENKAKLKHP